MKPFLSEDFLLRSDAARRLYFDYAKDQPIFDWHCHLPPEEIEQNRQFDNLTQMWLEADHYKWRVMRLCGVDEARITGSAPDREKYDAWVRTISRCIGNPLYHWTHLELARCFGIRQALSERTADEIWRQANELIATPEFCVHGLLQKFNVRTVFTTDDPADSLSAHRRLRREPFGTAVLPAFRPDKALHPEQPGFPEYLGKLGAAADLEIGSFEALKQALIRRMDAFGELGCRASDQSMGRFPFQPAGPRELEAIFETAAAGKPLSPEQEDKYRTGLLSFLGEEYAARGWVMELHLGAMRNNNTGLFRTLGPDAGGDAIDDGPLAEPLSRFLDTLAQKDRLPKTVLFPLNPKDAIVLAALAGCFAGRTDGRLQLGTAWWFSDNRDGIEAQIKTYANLGVLANFIGMVTDSRSFLSYPRHEYFRRILCNVLGGWVENGEFPADYDLLGKIVSDICYGNAVRFFGLS